MSRGTAKRRVPVSEACRVSERAAPLSHRATHRRHTPSRPAHTRRPAARRKAPLRGRRVCVWQTGLHLAALYGHAEVRPATPLAGHGPDRPGGTLRRAPAGAETCAACGTDARARRCGGLVVT